MNYIELQPCPVCGAHPEKETTDLGRPGGHGYPGCHSYQYRCEKCKLVKGKDVDDIYLAKEVAQNRARETWNQECNRIKQFMGGKKDES